MLLAAIIGILMIIAGVVCSHIEAKDPVEDSAIGTSLLYLGILTVVADAVVCIGVGSS